MGLTVKGDAFIGDKLIEKEEGSFMESLIKKYEIKNDEDDLTNLEDNSNFDAPVEEAASDTETDAADAWGTLGAGTAEDSLKKMFELREAFMKALIKKYPGDNLEWPLDLSNKASQQYCRDIALRGVEEMFEALQHLKNWKPHRSTENIEFDKDKFLEEIVDAFNYFFSLIILAGFNSDDLYESYLKKDRIIHERLKDGY